MQFSHSYEYLARGYSNLLLHPWNQFNSIMPNVFSHSHQLDEYISILGLLVSIFHFYSNFKRNFCRQTVNLIRRREMLTLNLVLRCFLMSYKKDTSILLQC